MSDSKEIRKILVVDDEEGMRLTLQGILSKRGFEIQLAQNGKEAVEKFQKDKFSMVIMDIKMPVMNGVEAFLKIKKMEPKTAVILMTGFAMDEDIRLAIKEGVYSVLFKPLDVERLTKLIAESLEGKNLVLVVDEFSKDRLEIKKGLEQKGLKVVQVGSGEECLNHLKTRNFQLIVLVERSNPMDGLELLKKVKEVRPGVGVIRVAGKSPKEWVEEPVDQGILAMVRKPIDMKDLLEVVDHCLKDDSR